MHNIQYSQPGAMDELAKKLNNSFIAQLNASPVDSEDAPKLCAADLKYSRMLQGKRLKTKGAAMQELTKISVSEVKNYNQERVIQTNMVKLQRAQGGCLGTGSRRRTELTPICCGEW